MNQTQILLHELYRTRKSGLAMIEKRFAGVVMEPQVAAFYENEKRVVAELEQRLKKGAST